MDSSQRDERAGRDAALAAVVFNLTGLALQAALIVAWAKRDAIRRQVLRYRWHVLREWRHARERRLIAELGRDLSRMEHEGMT